MKHLQFTLQAILSVIKTSFSRKLTTGTRKKTNEYSQHAQHQLLSSYTTLGFILNHPANQNTWHFPTFIFTH